MLYLACSPLSFCVDSHQGHVKRMPANIFLHLPAETDEETLESTFNKFSSKYMANITNKSKSIYFMRKICYNQHDFAIPESISLMRSVNF